MRHCKAHRLLASAAVSDEVKTRLKQQYANVESGRPQTRAGQVDGGSAAPERKQNTARRGWEARIARQNEIDASIAAKADFEYLYDKPYEDRGIVRVAGLFTVESLTLHPTLGVDENEELIDHLAETKTGYDGQQDFATMILEHLNMSGGQQAHRENRISFTALTPWPGDLKNTGKGNLFVIFGEPDIEIIPIQDNGTQASQLQVKVNGVDVFHPTPAKSAATAPTASPAGSSIPTTNEESFFVRHAYSLGANDPNLAPLASSCLCRLLSREKEQ